MRRVPKGAPQVRILSLLLSLGSNLCYNGTMPYTDKEKQKAAQRRYYERNKEKVKSVAKDRRRYVVRYIQEYKQSRACMDCGIDYPYWIMEFDHRPEETKLGNISMMYKTHSLEDVKLEIEKCDVVCSNCHKDRTRSRLVTTGEFVLFID